MILHGLAVLSRAKLYDTVVKEFTIGSPHPGSQLDVCAQPDEGRLIKFKSLRTGPGRYCHTGLFRTAVTRKPRDVKIFSQRISQ
jgi:hypothetical protein